MESFILFALLLFPWSFMVSALIFFSWSFLVSALVHFPWSFMISALILFAWSLIFSYLGVELVLLGWSFIACYLAKRRKSSRCLPEEFERVKAAPAPSELPCTYILDLCRWWVQSERLHY